MQQNPTDKVIAIIALGDNGALDAIGNKRTRAFFEGRAVKNWEMYTGFAETYRGATAIFHDCAHTLHVHTHNKDCFSVHHTSIVGSNLLNYNTATAQDCVALFTQDVNNEIDACVSLIQKEFKSTSKNSVLIVTHWVKANGIIMRIPEIEEKIWCKNLIRPFDVVWANGTSAIFQPNTIKPDK